MADLSAEEPLLLNPYFDDPWDHFEACADGWIWHKTERGKATIEICHLNRKELREERRLQEVHVEDRLYKIIHEIVRLQAILDGCMEATISQIWNSSALSQL